MTAPRRKGETPAWCLPKRAVWLGVDEWRLRTAHRLRYPEVGDWNDQTRTVTVKRLGPASDRRTQVYEMGLAIHELVEAWLCLVQGVAGWQVDRWDAEQPGGYRKAVYRRAHREAGRVERRLIEAAGYSWRVYTRAMDRAWEAEQARG